MPVDLQLVKWIDAHKGKMGRQEIIRQLAAKGHAEQDVIDSYNEVVKRTEIIPEAIVGKRRSPGLVIFLSLITFGIYYLVWYLAINTEMKMHGNLDFNPALALLAQFVPIANLVSLYNTADRVRQLQLADKDTDLISPGLAILLVLFLPLIGFCIYLAMVQGALNKHWERYQEKF